MTMLNNSGVHCPAFLHEIKDITRSCSIKRKSASLNIGTTNSSLGSEFEVLIMFYFSIENFCNPTGPIFKWKTKKKTLEIFTFSGPSINSSKEYVLWDLL